MAAITCQIVPAERVRPLRNLVLRRGKPPESCVWDGDDDPDTRHFAVFDESSDTGNVVAIGTLLHRPHDVAPGPRSWQIRGMATDPSRRSQGLGTRVLNAMLAYCRDTAGGEIVWCNARTTAQAFYLRHGFGAVSDTFDIPGIGPHVVMRKRLA